MKFLFEDESFAFETLRGAGFTVDGAADLSEIVITAGRIGEGDEVAWHREWKALADRIAGLGEASLSSGHKVSAKEAFLRASNYYRMAEFFLRDDPFNNPDVAGLIKRSRDTFLQAAQFLDGPVEEVRIPYEGSTLPAYLLFVDGSGKPRPTIIYNNGFDSTREEAWGAIAASALRRGYNVIAFDGPGHGQALREDRKFFRPDWEAVMTPILDYAAVRPEFAKDKMALFGYSLGAYLVARAAAFDKRIAALILDDGMYDFFEAITSIMPPFLVKWVEAGKDEEFAAVTGLLMKGNTNLRWAMRNGAWTFGVDTYAEYLRKTKDYTLKGIIGKIECPTLVMEAEHDVFLKGHAAKVDAGLKCPHKWVTFTEAQGAAAHCHMGAMRLAHQTIFDWLDEVFD
jgi:pimeloyl-ACP methyl ester carboxylesterase